MKNYLKLILFLFIFTIVGCKGGGRENKPSNDETDISPIKRLPSSEKKTIEVDGINGIIELPEDYSISSGYEFIKAQKKRELLLYDFYGDCKISYKVGERLMQLNINRPLNNLTLEEDSTVSFTYKSTNVSLEVTPSDKITTYDTDVYKYTPRLNENGSDEIIIKVKDENGDIIRNNIVSINILPVNDPPLAKNSNHNILNFNNPIELYASDIDSNDLTIISESPLINRIENKNIFLNYFEGTKVINYKIYDGRLYSQTKQITLNSNVEEAVELNKVLTTFKNTSKVIALTNSTDEEIEVIDIEKGGYTVSNGSLTYIPMNDFIGADKVLFKIKSENSSSEKYSIDVAVLDPDISNKRFWPPNLFPIKLHCSDLTSTPLRLSSINKSLEIWNEAIGVNVFDDLLQTRENIAFTDDPWIFDNKADLYFQGDNDPGLFSGSWAVGEAIIEVSGNQMYNGAADLAIDYKSNRAWDIRDQGSPFYYVFQSVFVHELGHFLGFDHISNEADENSLMTSNIGINNYLFFSFYDVQNARYRYNPDNLIESKQEYDRIVTIQNKNYEIVSNPN